MFAWSDGKSTKVIEDNTVSLAFLNCDKDQYDKCCGVVYDVSQDQYPGSPFPVIFFHPCQELRTNYICKTRNGDAVADPEVAELPREALPTAKPDIPEAPAGKRRRNKKDESSAGEL